MKNGKLTILFAILFTCVMLFAGCTDVFKPIEKQPPVNNDYGKISISFEGPARTIFPSTAFDTYVYTFSRESADGIEIEPDGEGIFTLEVGSYIVEVQAYTGDRDSGALMASGESEPFTVSAGNNEPVPVTLSPVATEGQGEFTYTITYPAGADAEITLQKWSQPTNRTVTIDMYDSFGDGWNSSGALRINVNGNDIATGIRVQATAANNTPSGQRNSNTYSFQVNAGDVVELYWVTGSLQNENSFIVYYADTPPSPAFTSSNNSTWNGSNSLIYKLRNTMTSITGGTLLGSFTVPTNYTILPVPENIILNSDDVTDGNGITETLPLNAGTYLLTILLDKDGSYAGINETVHIYPSLPTVYAKNFSDTDFFAPYTVIFDANDADGTAPAEQTVRVGWAITLPNGSGLSKTDYSFSGWNTEADGTGIGYSAGSSYTGAGAITLYAQWANIADFEPGVTINNTFTVSNGTQWNSARSAITTGGNDQNYIINVTANFDIAGSTNNTFGAVTGIKVSIRGADHTLSLSSNGNILRVAANQTIIIWDITLQGRDNNASLVYVDNGTLEMNGSTKITRNTSSSNSGGGIYVNGGTFIMNGGEISDNSCRAPSNNNSQGGGVYVYYGTFTMNGGKISGNTARNATNERYGSGGGVFVTNGTFTMNGGEIFGNTAIPSLYDGISYGGGVYAPTGFRITNGVIYGSGEGQNSNAAANGAALYGNAQYGNGRMTTTNNTIRVVNGNLQ